MRRHKLQDQSSNHHTDKNMSSHCKRFRPQDVMKMGPNAKVPYQQLQLDEAPTEKQLSEADLQLKNMVQKQMNKQISLKSELAREKRFIAGAVFKDEQEKRAGTLTLGAFKAQSKQEEELQQLRSFGLTESEIKKTMLPEKVDNANTQINNTFRLVKSEDARLKAMHEIADKIQLRKNTVNSETSYSNVREMSRREMEIELSLHRGTEKAQNLSHLIKRRPQDSSKDDPVMQTLREYEEKERQKFCKRQKSFVRGDRKRNINDDDSENESDDDDESTFVGPILAPLHIRVEPLDEAEVKRNRLNTDEIRSIQKFSNYDPGIPSKVLYVKNLPRDVNKEDLAQLFVRFETRDNPVMEYRVLDGRMKGQAFVTFKDVETAMMALNFANGFILKKKPIIISYGKGGNK